MTIDGIWLFGSSLYKEKPRDVDVLITYHVTPEDDERWREHCEQVLTKLPPHECRRESAEYKTALALKRGMRKVEIHFARTVEDAGLKTKCFILAWSRTNPNIRENLARAGCGSSLVGLLGEEISSLRKQLRSATQENWVLTRICDVLAGKNGSFGEPGSLSDEEKALVALNVLSTLPKKSVSEKRIREILRKHGFPEERVVGERQKGRKVSWMLTGGQPSMAPNVEPTKPTS
jgi:hypothetical protein